MVDNELLVWMHQYKQCSAHYDHWFASKQMQIHCSLLEVAAVNTLVDEVRCQATLSRQHRLEKHSALLHFREGDDVGVDVELLLPHEVHAQQKFLVACEFVQDDMR